MADLDRELVERVARWCAEAGRTAGVAEIRAALGGLGWDEVLALRALLADPPPAAPLGPYALADLARGVPADLAVERERTDRYPKGPAGDAPPPPPAPEADAGKPLAAKKGARRSRRATVVVRKPVAAPPPAPPPRLPLLDQLMLPEGRAVLERLQRKSGAARPRLLAALSAGHRRADGEPISDADLDRLLAHHGQARAFQRREKDELLHALRAAGGVRTRAAAALGYAPEALDAALERAGAAAEAGKLRDAKRRELEARASTLSEKARLLLADPERLDDLGLLAKLETDLRARLPGHLALLAQVGPATSLALADSLALPRAEVEALLARLGVPLPASRPGRPGRPGPRDGGDRPPRRTGDRPAGRSFDRPARPAGDRPSRPPGGRPSRPPGDRPSRPPGDRPSRPAGDRPFRPGRPTGDRPAGRSFDRPARPAGDRPAGRPGAAGGERPFRRPAGRPGPTAGGPSGPRPTRPGGPRGPRPPGRGRPPR